MDSNLPVKPGYQTTEFWTTLFTVVVTVVGVVFHKNFTGAQADIPVVAMAASGITTAVYTFSRSKHKSEVAKAYAAKGLAALADVESTTQPVPQTAAS